jgi:hypothetical protein
MAFANGMDLSETEMWRESQRLRVTGGAEMSGELLAFGVVAVLAIIAMLFVGLTAICDRLETIIELLKKGRKP